MDEQYIVDIKVKTPGVVPATKKMKELEDSINKVEKGSLEYLKLLIELQRLQNAAGQSTKKFGLSLGDLKNKLGDFGGNVLDNIGKKLNISKGGMLAIGAAAGGAVVAVAAVGTAIVAVGVAALALTNEFKALDKAVKSTGASGATLKELGNDAKFLKENFDIDPTAYAASINNIVTNFGLTTQQAAEAIKQAAIAGGNATGSLTDSINEYATQAASGGKTATEFFDSIVAGASKGAFQQDKLLDVSKEVTLRFKENAKATQDALKPLGDEFNKKLRQDFESGGKNIDEVLLSVIERTRELNLSQQETQTIIADLGGGPLEDLGNLDTAYKLITESIDATTKATKNLSQAEIEAIERSERKIALQRELADTLGGEVLRAQNAVTDAVFEVLEAIDTSGEGLKGLTDGVIDFIQKTGKFTKDLVILFQGVSTAIEFTGTAARVAIGIMTGGISEVILLLPDLVSGFNDATGAAEKFNKERDKKTTETNTNLISENLEELRKKYKAVGGAAATYIDDVIAAEKAYVASLSNDGLLSEGDKKKVQESTKVRIDILEDGEKKRLAIAQKYNGKISKEQQETLNNELDFYLSNNADIAATLDSGYKEDKAQRDKDLQSFLDTLEIKTKGTDTNNKKRVSNTKKTVKDLGDIERKAFEDLKKSFENNFELQRLEAQKDFAAGLINEKELREKIFGINQQENAVLITITANKKEIAKTGEEGLEISKLELKTVTEIKQELQAQLDIVNRIKEADKVGAETNDKLDEGYAKIELNKKIQEILDNDSIKGEKKKQKAIDALNREAAVNQLAKLKQDEKEAFKVSQDAQEAADKLAAEDDLTSTDAGLKAIKDVADAELNLLAIRMKASDVADDIANKDRENKKKTLTQIAEQTEKINGYIQEVTQGFQQALQADIALTESKLQQQEVRIAAGVELAKQGNDELLNQELERQDKLLEERKKQANKEKVIAAIQVASNLAVAIAKAAAEGGGFGSIATIAAVLGAVGIGFASIGGVVAGAFADGVIDFKGKGTGTSDSNIVAISHGESVITANGTKNASKMLTMINEGKLKDSDYLSSGLNLEMIEDTGGMIDIRTELNEQISISRELLDEMKNFEKKVNFSAEGVTEYVKTRDKIQTKLNTR